MPLQFPPKTQKTGPVFSSFLDKSIKQESGSQILRQNDEKVFVNKRLQDYLERPSSDSQENRSKTQKLLNKQFSKIHTLTAPSIGVVPTNTPSKVL